MRGFIRRLCRGRTAAPEDFDYRLVTPMVLGSILNPINSSMLAVALIPIGRAFDAPPAQTAWLVAGLYLATAVGQPAVGRFVDAFGPRRLYLMGTALVGVAGLLGVFAPDLGVLVVSRVLLGFGTSAAYPASMSLLRTEADRTGAQRPSGILATLTISNQIVTVAGPTLGGLLVGTGGWHLIFALNVPLAAACLVLGAVRLPAGGAVPSDARRVDVLGMVLFASSLTALMLFVMDPALGRWYLPLIGAAAGTVFVRRELAADHPFIDLRVLGGNRPLLATYARQLLAYTVTYTFLYGFSQWLQDGRGITPELAGLLQLPMALAAIAITASTGRRAQVRGKLLAGSLIQLLGCGSLFLLTPHSPAWLLLVIAAVFGLPHGLNSLANQNALYSQAEPERMGASAGLLRTATYLGALLSSAATAAFFQGGATTAGLHGLAWPMIGAAALFLLVSVADRSLRRVARDT